MNSLEEEEWIQTTKDTLKERASKYVEDLTNKIRVETQRSLKLDDTGTISAGALGGSNSLVQYDSMRGAGELSGMINLKIESNTNFTMEEEDGGKQIGRAHV